MEYITSTLGNLVHQTAFFSLTWGNLIMIAVACFFLYLAIARGFEPLLLVPIAFGMLLVNIYPDIMLHAEDSANGTGGLLYYFFKLDEWAILPSLIFLGVGAMTDFGPLIANPKSFLLGAAAQFGIFAAYLGAMAFGFSDKAAAAVSIIGGADGPTSIFLAGKLQQTAIMGPIAVAAYSYMALVPIIQPPIMKLLTTEKERKIKMEQLRPVSKLERILFPVIVTIVVCVILPTTAPLVGMLMLGNLFRESGVVRQLTETASNALMYIVVILLGTSVGATTSAEAFLNKQTIFIVILGLIAFMFGTAAGVLFGKIMCKVTGGKVNPLIGSAGVSAVPMAARVSQKVGAEADPTNFLLMHAMGPNVAGVIGTAVAAGGCGDQADGFVPRNVIAHLMLVRDEDVKLMAENDIVANCQPRWMVYDSDIEGMTPLVGAERAGKAYPLRAFLDEGVKVAFGTDFPVTPPPDTMHEIQCAMTRTVFPDAPDYDKFKGKVLGSEKPAALHEAVKAITLGGAYQMFLDDLTGSIEPGKSADLVIMDTDLENTPADMIYAAEVEKTLFKGKVVYEK